MEDVATLLLSPPHQERYQVRFDWGEPGARRIAEGAHVVVIVDELDGHGAQTSTGRAAAIVRALDVGPTAPGQAPALLGQEPAVLSAGPAVLSATEASAVDAAARILSLQKSLGDRAIVAIVAAGSLDDDGFRPCVEDLLAAGAVVDALADVGIDFVSPEAAAACAAYLGLRRATAHLATATVSASAGPGRTRAPDARGQRQGHPPVAKVLREFSPRA